MVTFSIGLMEHLEPAFFHLRSTTPIITWAGPVILMVAAIDPVPPRRMLFAGLLAASMDPLGMIVGRAAGTFQFDSLINAFLMHYPNYLMAGVAVVISGVVTRLGQQVAREREMGSYRLGDLLGRGGMGEVYKATHRMLARPAAIKLIRSDTIGANDEEAAQLAVKRFRREAEAAAALRSPHTVELYDFGMTDDQTLYFVMELLEGMTLEQMVREHGALLPRERFSFCGRSVSHWKRPTPAGSSTGTSSRRTSTSDGSVSSTTSSRCSTSVSSNPSRARAMEIPWPPPPVLRQARQPIWRRRCLGAILSIRARTSMP